MHTLTAETRYINDDLHPLTYPFPPAGLTVSTFATETERWEVLATMGIHQEDDESPLVAWRNAVADLNGLDRSDLDPSQGGALDLGFSPRAVRTFVFWLA